MAVIVGESAAWKEVLVLAARAGIVVQQPSDVGIQAARARKFLYEQESIARDDLARQEALLAATLARERAACDEDTARIHARFEEERAAAPQHGPRARVAELARQARERALVRARSRATAPAERALASFLSSREAEVARRVAAAREQCQQVESIAHSHALANAVAERAVIRTLAALPDDALLINDLRLVHTHDVEFEGSSFRTAQLDHLLIAPTGVYAIETRNWGTSASDQDDDPIAEVARGAALCSRILHDAGCQQIVRCIVACEGAPPTKSGGAHVAIVPTSRLLAYVQYGPVILSIQDIALVSRALART